ncbi:hypothetical protein B2J88_32175 [Rhodococcus sp. SRB_17]|nr:hypothetical protein [Rhodococcus sp. SRB_17]
MQLNGFTALYNPRFGTYDTRRIWALPSPTIGFGVEAVAARILEDHRIPASPFRAVFDHLDQWEFVLTTKLDKHGTRAVGIVFPRGNTADDVLETLGKALDKYALSKFFPFG